MVAGDVVVSFSGSFQPAATVEVVLLHVGLDTGSASKYIGIQSGDTIRTKTDKFGGGPTVKICINNTYYFATDMTDYEGCSGIQIA